MPLGQPEKLFPVLNDIKPTAKTPNSIIPNDSISKQKSVTCKTHKNNNIYDKNSHTTSIKNHFKKHISRYVNLNNVHTTSPTESKIKKPPSQMRLTHNLFPVQIVQKPKNSNSMSCAPQPTSRRVSHRIQDLPSHVQKLLSGFDLKGPLRKLIDHTFTDKEIQGIQTSQLRRFMLAWNKGQPEDVKVMQTATRDYLKPELLQECYKARDTIASAVKKDAIIGRSPQAIPDVTQDSDATVTDIDDGRLNDQ